MSSQAVGTEVRNDSCGLAYQSIPLVRLNSNVVLNFPPNQYSLYCRVPPEVVVTRKRK